MIAALLLALALPGDPRPCAAFLPPPAPRRSPSRPGGPATALAVHKGGGGKKKSGRRRRRRRVRHGVDADLDEDTQCYLLDREDLDHRGLAKSIDAEYAIEEAKRELSFWEVLAREQARRPEDVSAKSRDMSAWARTRRRMTYSRGDVESKYTLMATRSYGAPELLDRDHLEHPPTLEDLNQPSPAFAESYWSRSVFRVSVVAGAYCAFPLFLEVFESFQTVDPYDFDSVVEQLAPNVGVLYATLLALTLQVLYSRITRIEENVTLEATLLSQVTRNLLSLFADEPEWATEACQVVANQLRIMISRTRGVELLSIMKSDTYSNLLAIINDYHYLHGCDDDFSPREESVTNMIRTEIGHLMETRAYRLSDEAASLPPTHFLLVFSLSFVSVVAFVTASIKVVTDFEHPPQEASLLFAGLLALYILFFNFCRDLNGPFVGVYQIKRSNAVSHLMQTKWLIKTQLGDAVDFSERHGAGPAEAAAGDLKALLLGPDTEDIVAVEATTMQTLVEELEDAEGPAEAAGDLASLRPGPDAEGIAAVEATAMQSLAEGWEGAVETTNLGGAREHRGEEPPAEGSVTSSFPGPQAEGTATAAAHTVQAFVEASENAVETTDAEEDPRDAARPATSLDRRGEDGGDRLPKMQEELARLKRLRTQLVPGEFPSGSSDPAARLHHMLEELAGLKQLNRQLTATGHGPRETRVPPVPPTADADEDRGAATAAVERDTRATAVGDTAPAAAPRAHTRGAHPSGAAATPTLRQMEDELAGLKRLHRQLAATGRGADDAAVRRAGVGERRRP